MIYNFQKYFRDKILSVEDLKHKGNNRLYKVITSKKIFLLKKYSTIQKDNWNRGKTEFRALNFFWNKKIRNIPQPFIFNEKDNIGVYSFESGKILKSEEIGEKDIIEAANFLAKIHNLDNQDKLKFPLERTSCLSFLDYIKLIENRIKNISEDFSGKDKANSFWINQIIPKANELKDFFLKQNKDKLNNPLLLNEQVITPGDFGFHNILRDNDKYIFLDFEFCGRDDPAKQILDFLHHDKTRDINRELKKLFIRQYKEKTFHPDSFEKRLYLLDPLIGMNWILIYLNPLSKTYQEHMKFAGFEDIDKVIEERIDKAEKKLNNIYFFN